MEIKQADRGSFISLSPVGDMDAHSSMVLDEKLQELIHDGKVMIHIDASEIEYISSAGLGVFISQLDELNQNGGKLIVSDLKQNVKDTFELLGLNQLLTLLDSGEDVEKHFS